MIQDQDLELPTESTMASRTHFWDLNFDCIHEISSFQCLSILDLCSIGEAHPRLKEVVDNVFAKRHKKYKVDLRENIDLRPTKRILKNFGSFISELLICGERELTILLDLVMEYYSSKLKSIEISRSAITKPRTIKLKPLFGQLQKISLHRCTISSGKTLFSVCESLAELEIENVKFDDQHLALENVFQKLHRFGYWDYISPTDFFSDSEKSNDFFSRHQNLKSLSLHRLGGISHLLPAIADRCKQLEDLDITFEQLEDDIEFEKALSSILTLTHLNKLWIRCSSRNITKFIQQLQDLKSLTFLTLRFVECDSQFVPALSKLTNLDVLKVYYCHGLPNLNQLGDMERLNELKIGSDENLNFSTLVSMIKRLVNLKNLFIEVQSFAMDKTLYLKIVDVVRKRPYKFQDALQITCHTANDDNANSFGDGNCRKLVRIIKF